MVYRILLVEDEENLRSAIRLNLEMEGHHVTEARDGKIGFDNFRSAHFDLIILDVMLPEMDGYTLCQKIRLENTQVPIIFLTAKGASDERVQGLKLGADDYLSKPFNLEELLLRVNGEIIQVETLIPNEKNPGKTSPNAASCFICCCLITISVHTTVNNPANEAPINNHGDDNDLTMKNILTMPNTIEWLIASLMSATPRSTKNIPGKQQAMEVSIAIARR